MLLLFLLLGVSSLSRCRVVVVVVVLGHQDHPFQVTALLCLALVTAVVSQVQIFAKPGARQPRGGRRRVQKGPRRAHSSSTNQEGEAADCEQPQKLTESEKAAEITLLLEELGELERSSTSTNNSTSTTNTTASQQHKRSGRSQTVLKGDTGKTTGKKRTGGKRGGKGVTRSNQQREKTLHSVNTRAPEDLMDGEAEVGSPTSAVPALPPSEGEGDPPTCNRSPSSAEGLSLTASSDSHPPLTWGEGSGSGTRVTGVSAGLCPLSSIFPTTQPPSTPSSVMKTPLLILSAVGLGAGASGFSPENPTESINALMEEMKGLIRQQGARIEQQDARIEQQDALMEEMRGLIEQQSAHIQGLERENKKLVRNDEELVRKVKLLNAGMRRMKLNDIILRMGLFVPFLSQAFIIFHFLCFCIHHLLS